MTCAVLSVRFEVGVSILLAHAEADKHSFSSCRVPVCRNTASDSQESTHRSSGWSQSYWKHCMCENNSMFITWLVFVANVTHTLIIWQTLGHYSAIIPTDQLWLQRKSRKPYNKQLITLECTVLTEKSQTFAFPYWPGYPQVIWHGLHLRFSH